MKKLLLTLSVCGLALCASAQMGKRFPSEKQVIIDPTTGVGITVLTSPEKTDKALYQTDPMWTADGKYILFRSSSRTNEKPREVTMPNGEKRMMPPCQQVYFIEQASGEIIQASEGDDMDGSYLAKLSNKMFYFRRIGEDKVMYEMNLDSLFKDSKAGTIKSRDAYERKIGAFPKEMGQPGGYAVDCMDDYAYITVSREPSKEELKKATKAPKFETRADQPVKVAQGWSGIRKMNLKTGEVSKVIDADFRIGHIQTSLFTPGEIVYCWETGGDAFQRMWFCTAEGKVNKPLYKETPLDWVTHETFATKDYVYFNILGWQDRLRKQASGIARINLRTDDVELLGQVEMDMDRTAADIPGSLVGRGFWHCNASRDGKWAAGDTFAGNVWLINIATGEKHLLVTDTKMKPDHAHPYFSPDSKKVLFQSGHLSGGKRLNLMLVNIPQYFN